MHTITTAPKSNPAEAGTSIQVRHAGVFLRTGARPLDSSRPVLVLIHGAGNDASVWRFQARALARAGWCVVAPDLPGHGRSAGPALSTTEAMATWVLELIEALGIQRLALGGHSMGSLVAIHAAATLKERVDSLMLLGTAAPMPVAPSLLALTLADPVGAMQQIGQYSVAQPRAASASHPAETPAPDPAALARSSQVRAALIALMARNQAGYCNTGNLLHTDLNACDTDTTALASAAGLPCAVHIISGTRDKMTPPKAAAALQAALGSALSGLHSLDCGHTLMAEQPRAVLQAMLSALRGSPQPGQAQAQALQAHAGAATHPASSG
jgi:pimeloyl-ACP methyl ester carboxylesterase